MDEQAGRQGVRRRIPPLNLRILIALLMFLAGAVPLAAKDLIQAHTMRQSLLEERQAEIQNRSQIFASRLARSGYLKSTMDQERDTAPDTEMDTVASIYSGRLLVIDSSLRIIRDSFHLAEGRYHLAPEVLRSLRGDTVSVYHEKERFLIQATPVYDSMMAPPDGQERKVEGVLLMIASTEPLRKELEQVQNSLLMFDSVIILLLLVFCVILSGVLMGPLGKLRDALKKISDGDLNYNVQEETYTVTADMSESVNRTLTKLKALDQSRSEFVSNVSHELKTPITSVRVLADSLMSMEDVPAEMYREFMNDISREIDREAKIIDNLLSLVRMERQGGELNRKAVDMHAMLEQVLKRVRPIARLNGIDLTLETVREVTADVDEVKFSLAVMNLVENAVKYNVKDGWVHVSLDADHQFCYIRVSDSGIGLPEDKQDKVFERFYRVDKARSRETGGTGLGLAITRDIILMHGGSISLTSKEGEGCEFLVQVPLNYIENSGRKGGPR